MWSAATGVHFAGRDALQVVQIEDDSVGGSITQTINLMKAPSS